VRRLHDAALVFNLLAISEFGGRSGKEREEGLTELLIGSAFQTFDGEDLYPDPFDKAAIIMRGIVQGHPFNDGNKRTGFLTTYFYLDRIGYPPVGRFSEDEVVDFCIALSKGAVREIEIIAAHIAYLWGYSSEPGYISSPE
jgi:death-on-curing protein